MNSNKSFDDFCRAVVDDLALFSRLMAAELDRPLLEWLRVSRYPQGLGLSLQDSASDRGIQLLSMAVNALPDVGARQGRDELALDYANIFMSREREYFATESYWFSESGGQRREMVEAFYERHGYSIADRLQRPADTLAFELGFLAHLLDDEKRPPSQMLGSSRQFLTTHLISWAPRFSAAMFETSATPFYQGLAQLLGVYLPALEDALGQVDGDILSVPA
ncbi:putative Anaerobic dehydrogenase-like component [Rhodospirillaceae bacterium LM-1]|nr:putative Anaerobic dehydrogenase-like component [Rhodospirillaceae bacterium LM-1]